MFSVLPIKCIMWPVHVWAVGSILFNDNKICQGTYGGVNQTASNPPTPTSHGNGADALGLFAYN